MADVGFLGLGAMGTAMAARLVDAGHTVHSWNRSSAAVDELVALGAVRAPTSADALAQPVSFSMLANDDAALATLGDFGPSETSGRVHANMASVSPDAADRLAGSAAAAGVGYVAAPVLGRPPVAAAGKLNILAAGEDGDIDTLDMYFAILGSHIWRLGNVPRMANVVKTAVNYNIIHTIQALGESIGLVEAHGLDSSEFVKLLTSTLFGGVVYSGYGTAIAERRYSPPGFAMELGLKDLGLAESVAAEVGMTLPSAGVLRGLFKTALADDELRLYDWAALAEVTRRGAADPLPFA